VIALSTRADEEGAAEIQQDTDIVRRRTDEAILKRPAKMAN